MSKKTMTQETKDKIRKSHTGLKHSPETIAKIKAATINYVTPEFREKMRQIRIEKLKTMTQEEKDSIYSKRLRKVKLSDTSNVQYWKHRLTGLKKYRVWKNQVLKRDGFKCTLCNSPDNLISHHKIPISVIITKYLSELQAGNFDIPELWDISNGITRCNECHQIIDHKRRTKKSKIKLLLQAILKYEISETLRIEIENYLLLQ